MTFAEMAAQTVLWAAALIALCICASNILLGAWAAYDLLTWQGDIPRDIVRLAGDAALAALFALLIRAEIKTQGPKRDNTKGGA